MGNAGQRPSGQKATLPLPTAVGMRDELAERPFARPAEEGQIALLPTPTCYVGDRVEGQLPTEVAMLPTPVTADGDRTSEQGPRHYIEGDDNPTLLGAARRSEVEWGVYEAAVRRWETVFGHPAPAPTDRKGRLAPEFVEWMLGYPPGWFDVDGVSRTRKLRALGNSVQVACAEAVGSWFLALLESGLFEDPGL